MLDTLEPLDPQWVQEQLSNYPFVKVEGVTNVRTLGSYPVKRKNIDGKEEILAMTRPNQLFRSAEISGITEKGLCLNITLAMSPGVMTKLRKDSTHRTRNQKGV